MKRSFLLLCVFCILWLPINADTMIEIGSGGTDNLNPHHTDYDFAYSQFIYLQSQINSPLIINQIALYWNGGSDGALNNHWVIYLAHTSLTQFGAYSSPSSWIDSSTMTQVYTGYLNLPLTPGWVDIALQMPFVYNNTDNLAIAVNEITPGHTENDQGWFVGSLSPMRGIRVQRDVTPFIVPQVTASPASQNIGGFPHIRLYQDAILMPPPGNLTAEVTGNTVVLHWVNPSGFPEQAFKIYRNGVLLNPLFDIEADFYTDENVPNGTHTYTVTASYPPHGDSVPATVQVVVDQSSNTDIVEPMQTTQLFANYPNPFNPTTTIHFALTRTDKVKIDIYSVNGQLVRSLVSGLYGIGEHNIVWNGLDNTDHQVSSGVYFYRMSTSDFVASRKMLLMK